MDRKVTFLLTACVVLSVLHSVTSVEKCRLCSCENKEDCNPLPSALRVHQREVMVISENAIEQDENTWKDWAWDSISMVVSNGPAANDRLMCYAHMKGARYGFIKKLTDSSQYADGDAFNKAMESWREETIRQAICHSVDVLVLDMMDLLLNPGPLNVSYSFNTLLINLKKDFTARLKYSKLACVVPWKPPCIQEENGPLDCDSLITLFNIWCDSIITSTESFLHMKDEQCRAQATIPMTKMILGVDEYIARGIHPSKFMLGIAWHGYEYACDHWFDIEQQICYLAKVKVNGTETNECDYSSRTKKPLSNIMTTWPSLEVSAYTEHKWSTRYYAPFFNRVSDDQKKYQLWFEDVHSLIFKYGFVKELNLKGVVIWTANDLKSVDQSDNIVRYDHLLWNMLKHQLFSSTPPVKIDTTAGKVAGAAFGCLILGALVGFLITYCACVRRRTRNLKAPFMSDRLEFKDDDIHM